MPAEDGQPRHALGDAVEHVALGEHRHAVAVHGHRDEAQRVVAVRIGELAAQYATHERLRVIAYADMGRYVQVMMEAAAAVGVEVPQTDVHAGGLETSQMLFLESSISVPPGLEGYVAAEPGWLERVSAEGIHALSANGVLGRPAVATAKAGAAICAALADEIAAWMARELDLGSA